MAGDDERYPVQAPGWAAIDRVLAQVHPGQVPHQFTSPTAYDTESQNPLPAIGVYEGRGPSHWHYVTYGLTELFEKSSPIAQISGFGYELTFALPRADGEAVPPTWPLALLQGVGAHVLAGHGTLDSGHLVDLGGPLAPDLPTALTGLLCVPDPRLGKLATPFGSVLFLAVLGVTADELTAMQSWSLETKVGLVADVAPLAITDPGRAPWQEQRASMAAWRRALLGLTL